MLPPLRTLHRRALIFSFAASAALSLSTAALGQKQPNQKIESPAAGLSSPSAEARTKAAESLAEMGPEARDAVPQLIKTLEDENARVRRSAAFALGKIGADAKDAVPALTRMLDTGDGPARRVAAFSLGEIGSDAHEAVPRLIERLKDEDWNTRVACAQAIGQIRAHEAEAIPALLRLLHDPNENVSRAADLALQRFGTKLDQFVPELIKLLDDPDERVRAAAAAAIGSAGRAASRAIPRLIQLLKDEGAMVRVSAAQSLGMIGPDARGATPHLIELLKEREKGVKTAVVKALGGIRDGARSAIPPLTALLRDPDTDLQSYAAAALSEIASALGGAGVIDSLEELKATHQALEQSQTPNVRKRADAVKQAIDSLERQKAQQPGWLTVSRVITIGVALLLVVVVALTSYGRRLRDSPRLKFWKDSVTRPLGRKMPSVSGVLGLALSVRDFVLPPEYQQWRMIRLLPSPQVSAIIVLCFLLLLVLEGSYRTSEARATQTGPEGRDTDEPPDTETPQPVNLPPGTEPAATPKKGGSKGSPATKPRRRRGRHR